MTGAAPRLLPCVEVGPKDAAGAVVWLHGLGADGHDFEPIVPHLRLPRARFVFPHAPSMPVTINGGMVMPAWYDILGLDDVRARSSDVHASARLVEALVAREEPRFEASRIVLAGFSQGGAMALHVGLRYPRALAGVLVLSGYEVLAAEHGQEDEANRKTPLLSAHGTHDPLVPRALGRLAFDAHAEGRDAQWAEFPIAHEVSLEEIERVGDWLAERLPGTR